MTALLAHGTQDLYPTFLQKGRTGATGLLTIIGNVGAIGGGLSVRRALRSGSDAGAASVVAALLSVLALGVLSGRPCSPPAHAVHGAAACGGPRPI